MRYAFIKEHRTVWLVKVMCEVLQVSVSGYRRYVREESTVCASRLSDAALTAHIRAVHAQTRGAYGSPRVLQELQARGIPCGKARVERLMREGGIVARDKKKYKATTDSGHSLPVADNLLNRDFSPEAPNQRWAGDITFIGTDEGWLYLAVVIDLFSRRIIGWSLGERITRQLAMDALSMAWFARGGKGLRQCVITFHSDRGSQYASGDYQDLLTAYGITCSMSRKGNCWDNAVVESTFGSLKVERLHGERFASRREAKDAALEWLRFYNRTRLHSTLGYCSPVAFEDAYWAAARQQRKEAA